jgi:GTP-binding protein Era
VVALLGRPNAGKSSLQNRLLGEKLAIVTARPQTTRSRILGVLSLPHAQLLLVDTPGLQAGRGRALGAALDALALAAAEDCDVAALLLDPREGWGREQAELAARVAARGRPLVLVGTKLDLPGAAAAPWPPAGAAPAQAALRVSAQSGEGLAALVEALVERLPASPPLYPEEQLSDRPLRFLAAERVREAAFEELWQELPHALAVEVVEYDEGRADLVRIRAELLVERAGQKRIAIGSGGAVVKRIGTRARRELEALLGTRVYLELRVKLEPGWWKRPKRLKSLGYC